MHFHKWSKWEVDKKGDILQYRKRYAGEWYSGPKEEPLVIGYFINQKRTCLKCGKIELDIQEEFV